MGWFLIKRLKGGFTWESLMELAPFEFELFYNMAVQDLKEEMEENKLAQEQKNKIMQQLYDGITGH